MESELIYTPDDAQPEPVYGSENLVKRDEHGRILPGQQSLNPAGKPKGTISLTTKIKNRLKAIGPDGKREVIEQLADNIVQDALDGKDGLNKLIWAYLDGMPRQSLGLGGENVGDPLKFTIVNSADVHSGDVPAETVPTPTD